MTSPPSKDCQADLVSSVLLKRGNRPFSLAAMFKFSLDHCWVNQLKGVTIFCKWKPWNPVYEIFLVWRCMMVIERRISECNVLPFHPFFKFEINAKRKQSAFVFSLSEEMVKPLWEPKTIAGRHSHLLRDRFIWTNCLTKASEGTWGLFLESPENISGPKSHS